LDKISVYIKLSYKLRITYTHASINFTSYASNQNRANIEMCIHELVFLLKNLYEDTL